MLYYFAYRGGCHWSYIMIVLNLPVAALSENVTARHIWHCMDGYIVICVPTSCTYGTYTVHCSPPVHHDPLITERVHAIMRYNLSQPGPLSLLHTLHANYSERAMGKIFVSLLLPFFIYISYICEYYKNNGVASIRLG